MNFAVLGGDERSVCLVQRLRQDGHEVRTFGLECAMEPERGPAGLDEVLDGAECVILPIPLEGKPGLLNAPFGETDPTLEQVFAVLPGTVPVFAGAVRPDARLLALQRGIAVTDLLSMEELAVKNAALTAEGALGF